MSLRLLYFKQATRIPEPRQKMRVRHVRIRRQVNLCCSVFNCQSLDSAACASWLDKHSSLLCLRRPSLKILQSFSKGPGRVEILVPPLVTSPRPLFCFPSSPTSLSRGLHPVQGITHPMSDLQHAFVLGCLRLRGEWEETPIQREEEKWP